MRVTELLNRARGRWIGLLTQAGVPQDCLRNVHGPCPLCGDGKDRFRFDNKDGRGTYYCSQCGPGDGMDLMVKYTGWDNGKAREFIATNVGAVKVIDPQPKKRTTEAARKTLRRISSGCKPVRTGDPVHKYLRGRGLTELPDCLMCHPKLAYYENGTVVGLYPAMVAYVHGRNGQPFTVHITYLTEDGEKAPVDKSRKRMPGITDCRHGAVRLYAPAKVLGVAEGIETAIAAHSMTGLPVWSCLDANGLENFEIPNGIEELVIFSDHDYSFTGQLAAYTLANRAVMKGKILASVVMPELMGTDFNDELNRRREIYGDEPRLGVA